MNSSPGRIWREDRGRSLAAGFGTRLTDLRNMEFWARAEDIPQRPGAYVLAVELSRTVALSGGRLAAALEPGRYLYCGSAKGPGGLRARIARHMRHGKAMRWHIDRLTEAGRVLGAWTHVGGDECELVADLAHLPMPIDGFGSSDCRYCRSHLLHWPRGVPLKMPSVR